MAEAVRNAVTKLTGVGGEFEIGDCSWHCGNQLVSGLGFLKGPLNMREYIESGFQEYSQNEFIVYEEERYTFEEIRAKVISLASVLKNEFKIFKGSRVALCMRNYPEFCVVFLCTLYIGAVVVPLNGWWTEEELIYGLTDSGASLFICDQQRYMRVESSRLSIPVIVVRGSHELPVDVLRYEHMVNTDESHDIESIVPDDVGCIMYTSGTTSKPKGVVLTHRGMTSQMCIQMLAMKVAHLLGVPNEKQCMICPVPLFHVTASHHVLLSSLAVGRKIVLLYKWYAGIALELIQKERPNKWTGVPTMVQDLLNHVNFIKTDTSSLKFVGGGGAPTPKSQLVHVQSKFKNCVPHQGYGLTETNGAISSISGDEYHARPLSCGRPMPVVQAVIVDENSLTEVPFGFNGEILIKSPLVMREYWNRPDETAKTILTIPGKGHGWFRTGDIGHLDKDGFIYITDRSKDIIIRGGENISSAEVEHAVYENPNVLECAVFGIKDIRMGEEVGLAVVLKDGTTLTEAQIVNEVSRRLARFMLPKRSNIFLLKKQLPRGSTGKILKRALRDAFGNKSSKL